MNLDRFFRYVLVVAVLCVPLITPPEGCATKLSPDFKEVINSEFPQAKIRLDGAVEAANGELLLPLVPGGIGINVLKRGKPTPEFVHPNNAKPDLIVYTNGWCYVRVLKKGQHQTIVSLTQLPEKVRKQVLACHFPSDLIVPEGFVLPKAFKPCIADLNIKLVEEAELQKAAHVPVAHKVASDRGVYVVNSLPTGTLILLDGESLKKLMEFHTDGTLTQMTIVGGNLYVADQAKSRILILDPTRREFTGQIDLAPKSAPKGIVAIPNGELLYVSESGANEVSIIETATKKVLMRTKVPPGPGRVALTPDGRFLLVLNSPTGQLTIISTVNQAVVASIKVGTLPTAMDISKDGRFVFVSNRMSNSVSVIDLAKREIAYALKTGNGPTGLALNHDNTKLYVACGRENVISIFDLAERKKIDDVRLPLDLEFPSHLNVTPDGKKLFVTSGASDTLGMLNLETLTFDLQAHVGHTSHDSIWVPL